MEPPSSEPTSTDSDSGSDIRSWVPVIVATLSLSGVLGGALLSNWDKIFGRKAAPSGSSAASAPAAPREAGAQSPVLNSVSGPVTINYGAAPPAAAAASTQQAQLLARLQGVWLSPLSEHPYQREQRFRLRLELQRFGSELSAVVADIPEGRDSGQAFEAQALHAGEQGLDFKVERSWCCEDGKQRPYQVSYQLSIDPQSASQLLLSRRSNAPGADRVERFVMNKI